MKDLSFLTGSYDKGIERINSIGAPINFLFITDAHNRMIEYAVAEKIVPGPKWELAVDHINSMQYIIDRCPGIQCVISGGDMGNDYDESTEKYLFSLQEVADALHSLSVPAYCITGNHDDGIGVTVMKNLDPGEHVLLPRDFHRMFQRNIDRDVNYFYIDFPGYRFVFLDTSDKVYLRDEKGNYPFQWQLEVGDAQIKWFREEATATDSRIIVFSHNPVHNAGILGTEGRPLIKPYDDMLRGPMLYHFMKTNPKVIANISGHVHYDNIVYQDDSLLAITSLCSCAQEWTASVPRREPGTITETAFDVFSIKDDLIYITRFGAGENRIAAIERDKAKK
ncbi:MAG: hypothetical protein E7463_11590 [Ruminococcaceae bacterium]|nr:hypothetical protein [Oscillospiraceae bacterium]